MRAAEEAAFARGATAAGLMDEAAAGIARCVSNFFPNPGRCIVFAGKGNNAGDAFAAAQLLHDRGWHIELRLWFPEAEANALAAKKLRSLRDVLDTARPAAASRKSAKVVLDGLLGLGAKLSLRDPILTACREINALRQEQNAFVFAIDLPTGLDSDSGEPGEHCVIADFTVTVGYAKRGLIADRALEHVGRIEVAPLHELRVPVDEPEAQVATAASLRHLLPRRSF
ncbi:MAG: NAD(P)H-hydrate epimerase, partial [Verrucomicrobiota bacterium]|nr:NAD(P)H-hydrate epimerase [Verrucomicrobiota bacterium]